MSYSIRLTMLDLDGPDEELTYVIDNAEDREEALNTMDRISATEYAATGIAPRLLDGTPYWGVSDENVS